MGTDLTLTGALVVAISALAASVGVLYRKDSKRDDDSHKVALGMLEVLTLLKVHVDDVRVNLDRLVSTRDQRDLQIDRIENDARVHHERLVQFEETRMRRDTRITDLLEQIRKRVYPVVKTNEDDS